MRTTVTLEADTELLLREQARKTGRSFKVVLNDSIRRALAQQDKQTTRLAPLFSQPFPPSLAGESFNQLAEQWDDETTLQELSSS